MNEDNLYRLVGLVITVDANGQYGFIGASSITDSNGRKVSPAIAADVYIRASECAGFKLEQGVEVAFETEEDPVRKERTPGAVRAIKVQKADRTGLMTTTEEAIPGLARATELVNNRHPLHRPMKAMDPEAVAKAVLNGPLKSVPRDTLGRSARTDEEVLAMLADRLLERYPGLNGLGINFSVTKYDDVANDQLVADTVAGHKELGMTDAAREVTELYAAFKGTRAVYEWAYLNGWFQPGGNLTPPVVTQLLMLIENKGLSTDKRTALDDARKVIDFMRSEQLLTPHTVLPLRVFPEVFAAMPVAFFVHRGLEADNAYRTHSLTDNANPNVAPVTYDLCSLFPENRHWHDFVQLYNRRPRPVATFHGGDVMPPAVARLISRANQSGAFDRILVLTPYHDLAGADWRDAANWLRPIDPIVVAFKKGQPFFVVLARFSDLGVFPLIEEMLADTIDFLKAKKGLLRNFNAAGIPRWYIGNYESGDSFPRLGDHLTQFVDQLIGAYDQGRLFDWLRKEWDLPATGIALQRETATARP